jgi:hypothetical protein
MGVGQKSSEERFFGAFGPKSIFGVSTLAPDALINTPLQRGGSNYDDPSNRFSGFKPRSVALSGPGKPLKRFNQPARLTTTPLKRGVNEIPWSAKKS